MSSNQAETTSPNTPAAPAGGESIAPNKKPAPKGSAKAANTALLAPRADDPLWMHSTSWKLLSWVDPAKTGTVFGTGLFIALSMHGLHWNWLQVASYTAMLLITAGGVVNIAHSLQTSSSRWAVFKVNDNEVHDMAAWLGQQVARALQAVAATTEWGKPSSSVLALAGWCLTARIANLVSTNSLTLLWILSFIVPATIMASRDQIYKHTRESVTPILTAVATQLTDVQAKVNAMLTGQYKQAAIPIAALLLCAVLYLSTKHLGFTTTSTWLSVLVVVARLGKLTWSKQATKKAALKAKAERSAVKAD